VDFKAFLMFFLASSFIGLHSLALAKRVRLVEHDNDWCVRLVGTPFNHCLFWITTHLNTRSNFKIIREEHQHSISILIHLLGSLALIPTHMINGLPLWDLNQQI
jgi:hypothetical protein